MGGIATMTGSACIPARTRQRTGTGMTVQSGIQLSNSGARGTASTHAGVVQRQTYIAVQTPARPVRITDWIRVRYGALLPPPSTEL